MLYVSYQSSKMLSEVLTAANKFFPEIYPKFYFRNNKKIGSFSGLNKKVGMFLRWRIVHMYTHSTLTKKYVVKVQCVYVSLLPTMLQLPFLNC